MGSTNKQLFHFTPILFFLLMRGICDALLLLLHLLRFLSLRRMPLTKEACTMERKHYGRDDEILRARFTAWLESLMSNTRKNYIDKIKKEPKMVDVDSVPDIVLSYEDQYDLQMFSGQDSFSFEEEKLSLAFREMQPRRQRIITLLFAQQLPAEEVAKRLNCSIQYVYNQKSIALKLLREKLRSPEKEVRGALCERGQVLSRRSGGRDCRQ